MKVIRQQGRICGTGTPFLQKGKELVQPLNEKKGNNNYATLRYFFSRRIFLQLDLRLDVDPEHPRRRIPARRVGAVSAIR